MRILNKAVILGIITIFALSVSVFANSATVTELKGEINFVRQGENEWQSAAVGTVLADGDKIGSKEDSWAKLIFYSGHEARLGANSFMVIHKTGEDTSLEMFKGSLLSKVRKLSSADSYSVKTPQSVCSVRGTEFAINIGDSTQVIVYEGSVVAQELETGAEVVVPAGKYTIVIKNQPPSEPDDISNLPPDQQGTRLDEQEEEKTEEEEDTDEDVEEEAEAEEEMEDVKQSFKEELRQEMREAVQEIKVEIAAVHDTIEDQKDTDSSTGRTLRDVHGNLVRIEQYLLRPSNDTIQFINITKRSDYKYKGRMKVQSTGSRLDSVEFKAKFNMNLPEKISNWIGFFEDIDDKDLDFYPKEIFMKVSNQTDIMEMSAKWEGTAEDGDLSDPVFKLISPTEGEWNMVMDFEEEYGATDPRSLIYNESTEGHGMMWSNDDKVEMWMISPNMLLYKDLNNNGVWDASEATAANTKFIRSGVETWAINNDGNILDVDMFEDGDMNPFDIVKEVAFESSFVFRYSDELAYDTSLILNQDYDDELWTDAEEAFYQKQALDAFNRGTGFFSGNMDLVVTPDFAIPILEEIAKGSSKSM